MPTGKPHGVFSERGISRLTLMISIFFWKIIVLIFATYFFEKNLITHFERLARIWKKVHSQLVRPTVIGFRAGKCQGMFEIVSKEV